jgi:hypothetical protein
MSCIKLWGVLSTAVVALAVVYSACDTSPAMAAQPRSCPQSDAKRAEEGADSLKTWPAVYGAFKRFAPQCDDGAIGEGWDDSVTRLLAYDWKHYGLFVQLAGKDRAFERFVLRHLNGTGTLDDAWKVRTNARNACPAEGRALCGKIDKTLGNLPPLKAR